ncbi:conserved hypothetical protein [Nitrosococcus halophilus Nc 4]|uniref:Uncharacterized protein n=1 Tax=Nitrosococcus halophilus (strain Nc4) TaxID=472759 RepID=D5C1S2_NITHN|nr:hypothetical protein [Nitrosococcus halophilus]ADE14705.1 conserved hypothetical protein [Nitrosococcus halophilus Nc 4]
MNRYCFLLILALIPTLLLASPNKDLPPDFYRQIDCFLESHQNRSELLAQEAHQIVEKLTEITENREDFVQKVKELKSYLRLSYDFSKSQTLQRTLLLEEEINAHVVSWNQEAKQKRSTITWIALAVGALAGLFVAIVRSAQKERFDMNKIQKISINILIWAPITIGGGLSLGNLIAAKEVEQRQVLLVHPTELIRAHSGGVTMYEIESYLKAFLTAEKESSRSQTREELHKLYSKAPEQVEARIRYMKAVLEHAPQKLSPSKKEQQEQLAALQEGLSLPFPSTSSWGEVRYFLSDHLYEVAVAGAILGVIIFILSLHLSGGWSWPYAALSFLIGLNVGFALGQMAGELIKKETPHEILHYEVFF